LIIVIDPKGINLRVSIPTHPTNMLTTSILAVALVAGSAVAQTATKGSTALNFTYIDPTTVDPQIAGEFPQSAHSVHQLIH
jgi:uncharacterized membrane protein (DUF441 family)